MTEVVDAHHHVWDLEVRDQPWVSGDAMAPLRRSFSFADLREVGPPVGVRRTVLVQTLPDLEDTQSLLDLAAREDIAAAVVGWVDLTSPSVAEDVAALQAAPGGAYLRGIRHQVQDEPDPRWLCREDVQRGLAVLAEAGLTYDLLTLPHQLPAAVETVRAVPGLPVVLDHCAKPPVASGEADSWAAGIRTLAALPQVTCKLSGLVTEADTTRWTVDDLRPYVDVVLEAFGPSRLMFGSDWPVCLLASTYGRWVEAARALIDGLSMTEQQAVWSGTARKFYRL